DSLVLDGTGDEMPPLGGLERLGDAANREVIAFSAAAREDDLGRIPMDQVRDGRPRIVQCRLRLLAEVMNARCIAEKVFGCACQGLERFGGQRGRGVVVEGDGYK